MSREYPAAPISAVGTFVMDGERVLLAKRRNPPHAGEWSIPGGKQELAESLYDAARREVEEETGVRVRELRLLDVGDIIERDQDGRVLYHYTLIYFTARWASGATAAADDVSATRWFTLEEARGANLAPRLTQLLEKAFART